MYSFLQHFLDNYILFWLNFKRFGNNPLKFQNHKITIWLGFNLSLGQKLVCLSMIFNIWNNINLNLYFTLDKTVKDGGGDPCFSWQSQSIEKQTHLRGYLWSLEKSSLCWLDARLLELLNFLKLLLNQTKLWLFSQIAAKKFSKFKGNWL